MKLILTFLGTKDNQRRKVARNTVIEPTKEIVPIAIPPEATTVLVSFYGEI